MHDQGGGTTGIALLMIAFALPTVLAMGVAGLIADRFDSRPVLLISVAVQMLACAGLASFENRWSTYALVVLLQCGQAVANPTWGALTPRIAGDDDMGRVMALQQSLLAVTGIVGAALAGISSATWRLERPSGVTAPPFGAVLARQAASCAPDVVAVTKPPRQRAGQAPRPGRARSPVCASSRATG